MISLPARAIKVNFLDQKWLSEAKKWTFGTKFCPFGIKITKKVFLINDQLAGPSHKSKLFGSKMALRGQKVDFRDQIQSIWHQNHQKGFLINDQLAGLSCIKKPFGSKKHLWSKKLFSISGMNQFRRAIEKIKTLFRARCTS